MDRHRYLIPNSERKLSAIVAYVVFCLILSLLFVALDFGYFDWVYVVLKDAGLF